MKLLGWEVKRLQETEVQLPTIQHLEVPGPTWYCSSVQWGQLTVSNDELCLKDHLPLLRGQKVACTRSLQFRWISFSNVCINAFLRIRGLAQMHLTRPLFICTVLVIRLLQIWLVTWDPWPFLSFVETAVVHCWSKAGCSAVDLN